MSQTVSTVRTLFFQLLCAGLVCAIIVTSWYPERRNAPERFDPKEPGVMTSLEEQAEEKVFLLESQLKFFGLHTARAHYGADPKGMAQVEQLSKMFQDALLNSLNYLDDPESEKGKAIKNLERKQFIMAEWLKAERASEKLCSHFVERKESVVIPELRAVDDVLMRSCSNLEAENKEGAPALSVEESELLKTHLGWFAYVMANVLVPEVEPEDALISAENSAYKVLKIGAIVITMILASVICGSFLMVRIVGKSLRYRFRSAAIDTAYLLEIFALYLGAMLLMPVVLKFLHSQGIDVNPLTANMFGISSLTLFVWWPKLWQQGSKEIEVSLGLDPAEQGESFRNVLAGPFGYISAIVPLLLAMALYSLVLQALHVNAGEGAHPIVPILSQTSNPAIIYMIFFVAVVIAPFVEEIMFRGALYGWLRARSSVTASIIISSLIFAAVHPQGPIGLLPLTLIGMVLAFLREWRGTLVSPMLAHACFNAGTLALALGILR